TGLTAEPIPAPAVVSEDEEEAKTPPPHASAAFNVSGAGPAPPASGLTDKQRRQIVEQALHLLEDAYVHLPLKRAMHALDPAQQLRLLLQRLDSLDGERTFHDEMIATFVRLRDLHTNYVLPTAFQQSFAFLPFRIERYFENGRQKFLVSQVSPGTEDTNF